MTYATLMLHLELGRPNAGLLQIVGDLAERFHAGVIGIAACQPMPLVYGDGYVSSDLRAQDQRETARKVKEVEDEFRGALQARVDNLEWRSAVDQASPSDYLAREARSADLVITGVPSGDWFDASRDLNSGDLVMRVGRPVLIVPRAAAKLDLEQVIVGWKDSRESRRAAVDALPMLRQAGHVTVVEIAAEEEMAAARTHLDGVVSWLKWHGIAAESLASPSTIDDATGLYAIAQDQGADVIVAGAYGHSRLREWMLGGVTRGLLLSEDHCSLLSH